MRSAARLAARVAGAVMLTAAATACGTGPDTSRPSAIDPVPSTVHAPAVPVEPSAPPLGWLDPRDAAGSGPAGGSTPLPIQIADGATVTAKPNRLFDATPVIVDTDANNELDDQHALAYALLRPDRFDVVAITVNATRSGGPIADHVAEAERVLALTGRTGAVPIEAGASGSFDAIRPTLGDPRHDGHAAVDHIIDAARAEPELVVIAVGKLTNVALAVAKAPDIADGLRVVWLGGNYPLGGDEYNMSNDFGAVTSVLRDGVDAGLLFEMAVVRPGAATGTAAVDLTLTEAARRLPGLGPRIDPPVLGRTGDRYTTFGDYAADLFASSVPFGDPPRRALFDLAAVAVVDEPGWAKRVVVPAPDFADGVFVDRPDRSQRIVVWERFDRDAIVEDLFATLTNATP